jgi:hypothetical protein
MRSKQYLNPEDHLRYKRSSSLCRDEQISNHNLPDHSDIFQP